MTDIAGSDEKVFNANAVKRLAHMAGVARTANGVAEHVNTLALKWVDDVLEKGVSFLKFSKHKTLNISDLHFLSSRYPDLIRPFHVPSELKVEPCKTQKTVEAVLKGSKHSCAYTAKRPFNTLLHERLTAIDSDSEPNNFRLGNSDNNKTVLLLQLLAEQYIIDLFIKANRYRCPHTTDKGDTKYERETLNISDIDMACC